MATTKCRHQRIDTRYGFQRVEFVSKNKVSFAGMAKLVDALDLGSSGATHKSSSLFTRTTKKTLENWHLRQFFFFMVHFLLKHKNY